MDATKTSKSSWNELLSQILRSSRKVAFIGVGQELRGDDAAGVLIIRRLMEPAQPNPPNSRIQSKHSNSAREEPLFFEAGPLPEAATGALRRFRPDWAIFIDSADMGAKPGTVRWLEPRELEEFSANTHAFPLGGLSEYFSAEFGCRVAVLGIQPYNLEIDSPVSEEVKRAIEEILSAITSEFK
jgi:hydrogenase 3 maturation protease